MKKHNYIPISLPSAGSALRRSFIRPVRLQTDQEFLRAWCCIAYLFPGLHPDGFDVADSGWPRVLRGFAAEAWRRAEAGRLTDGELYPSDAQWCGIFDRLTIHHPDEARRRNELAAAFGEATNG